MKKITFLLAALFATMFASAEVITIDFSSLDLVNADGANTTGAPISGTISGVTFTSQGSIADATFNEVTNRTFRCYAGQTLTISSEAQIAKIEVIGMAKKGAVITASAGTVVGGDYGAATADTYAYENGYDTPLFVVNDVNAKSVVITPVKQIRLYGVRITTDATAIKHVTLDNSVYAANGTVYAAGEFQIFSVSGQNVTELNGQLNGIYIVKTANGIQKVAVK